MPRAGGDDGGAGVGRSGGEPRTQRVQSRGVRWAVGSDGQVERGLERSEL